METIYLDNNATTRIAPEVLEAMEPYLKEFYGNPSSSHRFGGGLKKAIEEARQKVASLLGAEPDEIVFTSSGTESDNTAVMSACESNPQKRQIITTSVEHPAVLNFINHLRKKNYDVTILGIDTKGMIDISELLEAITPETSVVSIMYANNETGVIFPIPEIAEILNKKGVLFHTDAVQAAGKIDINLKNTKVDMLSISGHKLHAPKGIGALYIRRGTPFHSYLIGGSQEKGRRAGTEPVALIVGLGKACEIAKERLESESKTIGALRDRLEGEIIKRCPEVRINGAGSPRLPNTSNISFAHVDGEAILMRLDALGIYVSTGSACKSGSVEPSHVLRAMSVPQEFINGSIRFSLGRYNTEKDIERVIDIVPEIIKELRNISPFGKGN
jgi:cysteine desulfurase